MEIAEDNPKTEGNNLTTYQDYNTIEDGALQVGISTPTHAIEIGSNNTMTRIHYKTFINL